MLCKFTFHSCLCQILPAIVLCKLALWVWRGYKPEMEKIKKGSSVDPDGLGVEKSDSKQITKVEVELINGKCHVENGDPKLTARCNETFAGM